MAGLEKLDAMLTDAQSLPTGLLAARMKALRLLLLYGRVGRVAVCGRRGSGKSSLLNALLGESIAKTGAVMDTTLAPAHYRVTIGARQVEWIDSPGLSAGDRSANRADLLSELLINCHPELLIVVHPASEVDAGIDAELTAVSNALGAVKASGLREPTMVCVLTKLDELEPLTEHRPPFVSSEKLGNIALSIRVMRDACVRHNLHPRAILPVNTWFDAAVDLRANVELIKDLVQEFAQTPVASDTAHEAKVLYLRLAEAVSDAFVQLSRRDIASDYSLQFAERMLAIAPAAARADHAVIARVRTPSATQRLQRTLQAVALSTGARQLSRAIHAARLRAVGQAFIDEWASVEVQHYRDIVAEPIYDTVPRSVE